TVEARSEGPGRGSEFLVRLPVLTEVRARDEPDPQPRAPARAAPARTPVPRDEPNAPLPARRVLVVDDNDSSAQSMALILKLEGYDVRIAYDGEAALETVRSFRPEVILMDIGLPGIDGHEVARRLRQDPDL